ncbi:MAG: integrin alpha [Planctomycetes bacterium]|nr:integrin alpha [Planctomycetota bacterium]
MTGSRSLPFLLAAGLGLTPSLVGQAFPIWSASGSAIGQGFGASVAGLGDVNGDGVPDVLVGAPEASPGGVNKAGYARVLSGADGLTLFVRTGTTPLERFGRSVSGLGDVDADGVADFVVGSPGAPGGGLVRVYSSADASVRFQLFPSVPNGALGWSVADAGDVTGDGIPDAVAGNPGTVNTLGLVMPFPLGIVQVFSGADGSSAQLVTGSGTFGYAVGRAGDLDGDGHSDILIGAPTGGPGAFEYGQGFVFAGLTGSILLFVQSATAQTRLGTSVVGPGDLDGDGVPDAVFGEGGPAGPWETWAFSGANSGVLWSATGYGGFGAYVASLGDLDADGVSEVAVGTKFDIPFSLSLDLVLPRVVSGSTGQTLWQIPVSGLPLAATPVVAAAGDATGDGLPDLLLGGPTADPAYVNNAGAVQLVSLVGVPGGVDVLGSGCAGSGGVVPRIQTAGGAPAVGNAAFAVVLSEALGGATAVLIGGLSGTAWSGTPLPLNLGFLGLPACSLLVSADQFIARTSAGAGPGAGTAYVPAILPASPSLAGLSLFFQWYVVDPGPLPLPGATSAGLEVVLQ